MIGTGPPRSRRAGGVMEMKSPQFRMLSGFNHNLRYRGQVYHVQTEDGGLGNPTIITHVFLGGVILSTVRRSYQDLLASPNWEDSVRERMKVQHLDEIRKLMSGGFDAATHDAKRDA